MWFREKKEIRKRLDAAEKKLRQLECKHEFTSIRMEAHSHPYWFAFEAMVVKTCRKCGYSKHVLISNMKPAEIRDLVKVGILDKSYLPKPKKKGK